MRTEYIVMLLCSIDILFNFSFFSTNGTQYVPFHS